MNLSFVLTHILTHILTYIPTYLLTHYLHICSHIWFYKKRWLIFRIHEAFWWQKIDYKTRFASVSTHRDNEQKYYHIFSRNCYYKCFMSIRSCACVKSVCGRGHCTKTGYLSSISATLGFQFFFAFQLLARAVKSTYVHAHLSYCFQ